MSPACVCVGTGIILRSYQTPVRMVHTEEEDNDPRMPRPYVINTYSSDQ
jgi:hypothetical protein